MPKKQTLSIQDATFFIRFCERLERNDSDLKFSAVTKRKILDALPGIKEIRRVKSANNNELPPHHYLVSGLIAGANDKDVLSMMSQDEKTRFSKMKSAFNRKQRSSDVSIDVYSSTKRSLNDIIKKIDSVNARAEKPLKRIAKKQIIDYLIHYQIVDLMDAKDNEVERFHRAIISHINDYEIL